GVGCNAPWGVPFDDKICEGLNCKSGGITVNASMPASVGRLFLFVVFFGDAILGVFDDNSDGDRDWWKFLSCFDDDDDEIWIFDGNGSLDGGGFGEDGLMLRWF
ncbi:unnamed protein product, partial [Anisakis simplex]|uniref:MAM domain-containing protein n=1 Tax=Anisakis simplex TaxID=6269 RepID=A0A0M3JI92_ANISI